MTHSLSVFSRIITVLGLSLALSGAVQARRPGVPKIPIVLSTDTGNEIDDQYVLLHALIDPRLDIRGIVSALAPTENIDPPAAANSARTIRQIVEQRLRMTTHPVIVAGSDRPLLDERHARITAGSRLIVAAAKGFSPSRRLTVVTTGAATDVASALLDDPTLADRVRIVAMGFDSWATGGREFNIRNDPAAWRVILQSRVPVVIGSLEVTRRDLSITHDEVAALTDGGGALQSWLLRDFDGWQDAYARDHARDLRRPDGTLAWVMWDEVTLAYLLGYTDSRPYPRPTLGTDLSFMPGARGAGTITWITRIDRTRLFANYNRRVRSFVGTHAVADQPCVTFGRSPDACWRK